MSVKSATRMILNQKGVDAILKSGMPEYLERLALELRINFSASAEAKGFEQLADVLRNEQKISRLARFQFDRVMAPALGLTISTGDLELEKKISKVTKTFARYWKPDPPNPRQY